MPTSIYEILLQLYKVATSERDKGDRFERLMAAYLRNDATWSQRFSDVWLWNEWPGHQGADTGIDLVAQERDSGGLTAIQCKFYDPAHTLQKSDIDSFFTASGKAGFTSRLIISTTDKWSKHAEEALVNQQIPTTRLRVQDLDNSSIDWSKFNLKTPEKMEPRPRKKVKPHQQAALDDVINGFKDWDRGQLIMACGTGKTFTALRLAEQLVGPGGSVLFLVPSISLLSQALTEWTEEAEIVMRPFAVCSDVKVGRKSDSEDIAPHDLAWPASTDPNKLHARVQEGLSDEKLTVVFSTYQSIQVVSEAQQLGLPEFDLIICDEAHRTTGATLTGEDESSFVRVHDQLFVQGKKRLYMTATPRIYDDASKAKATEGSIELSSMDDEKRYGPELHHLGFGEAVNRGLLTDYKVLVLAVDEQAVSQTFQTQLADKNSELGIDDAAKIVGCWNGLAKRGALDSGFGDDTYPMERAVAFSRSIKDSKRFAALFTDIVEQYRGIQETSVEDVAEEGFLRCEVDHVDGTFNVLQRNNRLDWLKEPLPPDACRILSNARCLAEGVDVPALDAVMFLNPRNSVVDVVQSVGRIMRLAPGKKYGYVILPIGIPADLTPEEALANNEKYKVVWQVLQALRAHDERFDAMINQIDLNKAKPANLQVIGVGDFGDTSDAPPPAATQQTLNFPQLGEWREAIYAKIVKKVGDRGYWEEWARGVSEIAQKHTTRIQALLSDPTLDVAEAFDQFLEGLRGNLNESVTREDAIDMLAQHLITKPVFDALFEGYSFAEHNPVSLVMQHMIEALDAQNLEQEQEGLKSFYDSVRVRAAGIDNAEGKQRIINELYEKFFKIAFPRVAESLGIVYTPVQVVDFILNTVETSLKKEFGASLSQPGVHVLDPFTGTGTFITRLLQSGLIKEADLRRKYTEELHANEILLLAYYIAAINIEATFHGVAGGEYVPFEGVVLTDTFQITELDDSMDQFIFPDNNERVSHQNSLDIKVIIGNPPYSVGQGSENDGNKNLEYPTLDKRIRETYAAASTAGLKRNLYDSYIRAFRWASDRIGDQGVICFVSNGSFIDAPFADGFRRSLVGEFSSVFVFNLRGNQRTSGEVSRQEGGKIFGQGSRTPVAITLLVKKPSVGDGCTLHYFDIGDYLTRQEKLDILQEFGSSDGLSWETLEPNAAGDWINQRDDAFLLFRPLGDKKDVAAQPMFALYSLGVITNRDAWAFNFSQSRVHENIQRMLHSYAQQLADFDVWLAKNKEGRSAEAVEKFVDRDPKRISWTRSLKADLRKGKSAKFRPEGIVPAMYRPYCKQWLYFDRQLNEMVYQVPKLFPTAKHENLVISLNASDARKPFGALITDVVPNLALSDPGQCFPLYYYEAIKDEGGLLGQEGGGFRRREAITDETLATYRGRYGDSVGKTDIFYYVYAVLHAPDYKNRFEADLKKMIPRIPMVEDFLEMSRAGRELAELHLNYESVDPWPLQEETRLSEPDYRVQKMRFGKIGGSVDKTSIVYNGSVTLLGIPNEAYQYEVNGKSALEWIMDRYQVKTDKASGIVNDPNDWSDESGNPRYVVDLVRRLVTVSMGTMEIIRALPSLNLP